MVNGTDISTFADVTLRELSGKQITQRHVLFPPHSQQQLDIGQVLLATGSIVSAGSLTIVQSPDLTGMSILAQLTITHLSSTFPNYIDEEVSMLSPSGSRTLTAVSARSDRLPRIAITSVSSSAQQVAVQCFGGSGSRATRSIQLPPYETVLTDPCSLGTGNVGDLETLIDRDEGNQRVLGISLTTNAPAGSFVAFGLTPHSQSGDRYFSGMTFDDPGMSMSANTVFTGVPVDRANLLPVGNFVPHVSVANFSEKMVHATVRYAQMIGGTASVRNVAQLTIAGGTIKICSSTFSKAIPIFEILSLYPPMHPQEIFRSNYMRQANRVFERLN